MDKFFSVFGRIALVAILAGGIAYGAYTVGRRASPAGGTARTETVTPGPTWDPGLRPESLPDTTPTPDTKPGKTIKAGLDSSSGLSFTKYQITVPSDWTENHTTENPGTWVDTLILTKGTVKLKIFQGATGGALCLYPEDANFEGPSSRYDSFTELMTADGIVLRRSSTTANSGATMGFTFCQKGPDSFGQPTVFGHMSLTTPINPDGALLKEADTIVASLKKL